MSARSLKDIGKQHQPQPQPSAWLPCGKRYRSICCRTPTLQSSFFPLRTLNSSSARHYHFFVQSWLYNANWWSNTPFYLFFEKSAPQRTFSSYISVCMCTRPHSSSMTVDTTHSPNYSWAVKGLRHSRLMSSNVTVTAITGRGCDNAHELPTRGPPLSRAAK